MKINIITQPRSGSTYLFKAFKDGFPSYDSYLEPFRDGFIGEKQEKTIFDDVKALGLTLFENIDLKKDNYITKNMIHQPVVFETDWINIKLVRNNVFEQVCSLCLAYKTGRFFSNPPEKITIETELFYKMSKFTLTNREKLLDFKADKTVYYEDLTFNPNKDLEMLGFKTDVQIEPLKKQKDKKQTISNYEELYELWQSTYQNKANLLQ